MDRFADAGLRPAVAGGWPGRLPPGRHRSHRAGRVPLRRSCRGPVRLAGDPGRSRLADCPDREHRARLPGDRLRDRPPIRAGGIRGPRRLRDAARGAAQPGRVPAHPTRAAGPADAAGPAGWARVRPPLALLLLGVLAGLAVTLVGLSHLGPPPGCEDGSGVPDRRRRVPAPLAGRRPPRTRRHLVRDAQGPGRIHGDQHGGALRRLAWPAHARTSRPSAGCRPPPSSPASSPA